MSNKKCYIAALLNLDCHKTLFTQMVGEKVIQTFTEGEKKLLT